MIVPVLQELLPFSQKMQIMTGKLYFFHFFVREQTG
jgi:hypothetical protein